MKRKINDFFAPLAKKPSVVSHILQARDPNLPEAATVIKKEPKDVKFVIKTENEFCEIAKKDKSGENAQPVKKTDATSPKKKSSVVKPSPQDLKVLRSLDMTLDHAELVAEKLPWALKRNAAGLVAFAAFIHLRQEVHVKRTLVPGLAAPFTDNETLQSFYFTNIFREADNGTKYYRRQILNQHEELSQEKLPEILFQTYIYRCVNKVITFQRFGGIPAEKDWDKFRGFMCSSMQDKTEENFFTQAHINQGQNKTALTIEYVLEHKEKMARQISSATSLKTVFEIIRTAPHVGPFLSWQITADLCELKLIRLKENFVALGPGAQAGLKKVLGEKFRGSEELEMTKTLTKLMKPVFRQLDMNFQYFLGRDMSLKAIEHSLCEFDKYYRAALEKKSKRIYRGGGGSSSAELSCSLCEARELFCLVEDIWWLCPRCTILEYPDLGRSEVRVRKVRVEIEKIKADSD